MLWGSSPCLDLAEYVEVGDGHLNILIVSAGDTRHLLQTLAKRYKRSYTKIRIYVYEPIVDMYARHIQQIALALEPVDRMSLSYKVLPIFFNCVQYSHFSSNTAVAYLNTRMQGMRL